MELSKEEDNGKWVTLDNGQKVFIREGETFSEAIGRLKPSVKEPTKNNKYTIQQNGTKFTAIIDSKQKEDIVFEKLRIKNGEVIGDNRYIGVTTEGQKKHMFLLSVRGSKHYGTNYKGAGTILVSSVIQSSFDAGFNGRVELISPARSNKFYEKLGFSKIEHDRTLSTYMIEGEKATKLLKLVKLKYGL